MILPTQAATAAATSPTTIEVCANNTVSTVDANGSPITQARVDQMVAQVKRMCAASKAAGPAPLSTSTYYNVVALISQSSSGTISIGAYANSLPYAYYTLDCIYRSEPVVGASGAWTDCGVVSGTNTSLSTRTNLFFCPAPGTRYHAHAELFNRSYTKLAQNDAWHVVT